MAPPWRCKWLPMTMFVAATGATLTKPTVIQSQKQPLFLNPPPAPSGGPLYAASGWEGYKTDPPRAVYIHMPFCRRRCYYCDFPIKVVGDRPGSAAEASEAYVEVVLRELRASTQRMGPDSPLHPDRVRASGGLTSIFFGGGTPSLTPPHLIDRVVRELASTYGLASGPTGGGGGVEVCMEMDPGTFDRQKLRGFLRAGVSRVSMGVQSFDAQLLQACGRAHSLEDVRRAVRVLQGEGVVNFSLDLIASLPNQTMEQWESSLRQAIACRPAHVSVYDLQVEDGTAFGRWYSAHSTPLPSEDLAASMYRRASAVLQQHGYRHYEVSNYAKPGFECRHNRVYWEGRPFLALGMGAASFTRGHRFTRPRSLSEYEAWVGELEARGYDEATGYSAHVAMTSPAEQARESVEDGLMVGLRLREGVDVRGLAAAVVGIKQAESVVEACREASRTFGPERVRWEGDRMRLIDPDGFLVSSNVIAELFAALSNVPCLADPK